MLEQWFLGFTAAGLSLLITPVMRAMALRFGVVSEASEHRFPLSSIPSLGGLAILLALFGSIGAGLLINRTLHVVLWPSLWDWRWPLAGVILVVALGLADDIYNVAPLTKIGVQLVAAGIVVASGHGVEKIINPFTGDGIALSWLAAPITVLWVIGITNAFNLIDGLDGLAAGVGLIASAVLWMIALSVGRHDISVLALGLAGALAGFLWHNFPPASIFMGDSGSMFVGYLLSVLYIEGAQDGANGVVVTVPILALGLPITDTLLAVIRRGLRKSAKTGRETERGLFLSRLVAVVRRDREHIHHRLVATGLKDSHAVLLLYGVCTASGFLALLAFNSERASRISIVVMAGLMAYFYVREARYRRLFGKSEKNDRFPK